MSFATLALCNSLTHLAHLYLLCILVVLCLLVQDFSAYTCRAKKDFKWWFLVHQVCEIRVVQSH